MNTSPVDASQVPESISRLLHRGEKVLYCSRSSPEARKVYLISNGILWGLLGLPFFIVGALLTVPLGLFLTHIAWSNRYYVVTDKRIITVEGVIRVGTKIVNLSEILMVSVRSGIIDQWLKIESFEFATAASAGGGGVLAAFPGLGFGGCSVIRHVDGEPLIAVLKQLSVFDGRGTSEKQLLTPPSETGIVDGPADSKKAPPTGEQASSPRKNTPSQ